MGDLKTNEAALNHVLERMFPAATRDIVQQALESQQAPIRTINVAAGAATTWKQCDLRSWAVLVLPGDPTAQLSATPMYLRFGTDAPPDSSSTVGALPAYAGSLIEIPQSSSKFWYIAPDAASSWLICAVRIPHVKLIPGPLAARLPNRQVLSTTTIACVAADPSLASEGVIVPAQAVQCRVQGMHDSGSSVYVRLTGSSTAEVWWLPVPASETPRLWAHNSSDDFSASALGVAGPDHDTEAYECAGLSRMCLVSAATDMTHAQVSWLG